MIVALFAVGAVTLGTLGLGTWGMRFARTTSDLLVASRAVTPWWNAAAISGEYLSAASFLGIAGLEMQIGASALWQSLGFTAGYLALLLFVAAPLRRYGSYTIPDFAEARLHSPGLRLLAAAIVLVIGGFYLVPQLKGAGLALNVVVGSPYWVGVVVVAVIVAVNVAVGGMRGITYVQAFQFWVKVFAIAVPAIVLLIHFGGLPERAALFGRSLPHAGGRGSPSTCPRANACSSPRPAASSSHGRRVHVAAGGWVTLPAHTAVRIPPDGIVPVASGTPPLRGQGGRGRSAGPATASPLFVYSLLIATFLGHDGPAACPGSLLHESRRPRGAAHDGARAGAAVALLPVPGRLRGARASADATAVHDGPDRRRRAELAAHRLARHRRDGTHGDHLRAAPSPRSSRPRAGCWSRWPARSATTSGHACGTRCPPVWHCAGCISAWRRSVGW